MINIEMLEETFGGDKEFIAVLFAQYLQDNSATNDKIQSQFDANQLDELFHTAHTLSGALSNICETDIVPTIKKVELSAKEGNKPNESDIAEIKVALTAVLKQMEEYMLTL